MKVYLAIPYSANPEASFTMANAVAASFIKRGHIVFSPVSHSHPISGCMTPEDRMDHELWMGQDLSFLQSWAEIMVVIATSTHENVAIDMIKKSKGCMREIETAQACGLDVFLYQPHMWEPELIKSALFPRDTIGYTARYYDFSSLITH